MKASIKWSRTEFARLSVTVALAMLILAATATSQAQSVVVYNSIPNPLPSNVASEGPEAYAFSELGDALALAGPGGRTLDKVTVVMSSWACTSGNWYTPGSCLTTPHATYTLPVTLNIYSVVIGVSLDGVPAVAPGSLLATVTQNFAIPYRPSANTVNCTNGQWYNPKNKSCWNGFAVPITFDLSSLHVTLPSQVAIGVQYNTSNYGPSPIGDATSCRSSVAGCFYDSLNISTDSNGGIFQAIGAVLNVDGLLVNYTLPNNSCSGAATTGVFGLDASPGCWTGYHPEIQITAKKNQHEHEYHHGFWHNGRNAVY